MDERTADESSPRGFILQPTYRIRRGRPVLHLWGRLDTDETFLVRDGRSVPHFYINATDEKQARSLGALPLEPTERKTMDGEPVLRVDVATPPDAPPLRDRLLDADVRCYEADVRFAMRSLIDCKIKGSCRIHGGTRRTDAVAADHGVDIVIDEPELEPTSWSPNLRVLSLDIETDPKARRLFSVAFFGLGAAEVLLFCPRGYPPPDETTALVREYTTERELFVAMCERIRELDPDVLLGWNVVDFDFSVLKRIGERVGERLLIGRNGGDLRLRPLRGRSASTHEAIVPGRVVLDGIQLLRSSFIRMESYGLDAVAREILGEGKVDTADASSEAASIDKAGDILRLFKKDRAKLVDYNLTDARLALEIIEKLQLIELSIARSQLTGMPIDRIGSSIAAFDFLYLTELGERRIVAPTVGADRRGSSPVTGGHVLAPLTGLYRNVLVFDFKSLYPSLIRTFQIDPLGYRGPKYLGFDESLHIVAPNGAVFRREPGILTRLLDDLLPRRTKAKTAGDLVASHAIKILMNSFYGVLGAPSCRFFDPELANAVTSFGRYVLLWSRDWVHSLGHRVLYGDTDSLFVDATSGSPQEAHQKGAELVVALNQELASHLKEQWSVESRLELELEGLYLRLFLPPLRNAHRHGPDGMATGASKRYAGLFDSENGPEVVFTGMEAVRRDWTTLAKEVQRELYERLFFDRPVEEYLRAVVTNLRAGSFDDKLIYRKALRKAPEAYTSTTPPHVAAARKLAGPIPRVIEYILTPSGPEPIENNPTAHDYDHYVEKQIRPVAEPVLALLGLDFKKIVGDDRQMALF